MSYYLPSEEYGLYYLGISITIFANQIFFGPFGNGFSRFYLIAKTKNSIDDFFRDSLWILIKLTQIIIFVAVIFFLVSYYLLGVGNIIFFSTLIFLSIFTGYSSIFYSYFHIIRERKIIAFYQLFDAIIKVLLVFISIYYFGKNAENVLVAMSTGSLLIFIHQLYYLYKRYGFKNQLFFNGDKVWVLEIIKFSYPFAIWGIFGWLQISSDRWFLGYFDSPNEVAKYAIVFQLGYYPPSIVIGNIVQTITPLLYDKAGDGENETSLAESSFYTRNITFLAILITFIGFVFTFCFSPLIVEFLSDLKYLVLSDYVPYMVFSGGIFSAAQILSIDFQSRLKTNHLLVIKVATSLFGVFLSGILIYNFGLLGAIIASNGFSLLYLISIIFFNRWLSNRV